MTIPSTPFSGCDCCGFGFEMFTGRAAPGFVYFADPSVTWNPAPGGGSLTGIRLIKRRTNNFEPVNWTNDGTIPTGTQGDIAVDDQGNFYQALRHTVKKYDSSFNLLWTWSGGALGSTTTRPWVDSSYNVWSMARNPTTADDRVQKLNPSGTLLWSREAHEILDDAGKVYSGTAIAQSLAVDLNGNSFLGIDTNSAAWLAMVDTNGNDQWVIQVSTGSGSSVRDIAVDASGNCYLTSTIADNVRCYDGTGALVWSREFESGVTQSTSSTFWHAICLDPNGDIIVGGQIASNVWAIRKIDKDDQSDVWTATLTTYLWALSLCSDKSGQIYAACNRNATTTFLSQRQYSSAGLLLHNDMATVQSLYCAASPGKHPHFI